jgi:hypothetical protein
MKTRPAKTPAPAPPSTAWTEPRVTRPGDAVEREADRMAEQALTAAPGESRRPASLTADTVMRQPQPDFEEEDGFDIAAASRSSSPPPAPAGFLSAVRSGGAGEGLAGPVLARMEQGFGRPLGHVRVHDDPASARLSDTIAARAFTHGQDIYFARGEYRPGTPAGDRLIAHELAHTLQQPGAGTVARQPKLTDEEKVEKRRQLREEASGLMGELGKRFKASRGAGKRPEAFITAVDAALRRANGIKDPRQKQVRLALLRAQRRLLDDRFYAWTLTNDFIQLDLSVITAVGNPSVTYPAEHLDDLANQTSAMSGGGESYVLWLAESWVYTKHKIDPKSLETPDLATGAGSPGKAGTPGTAGAQGGTGTAAPPPPPPPPVATGPLGDVAGEDRKVLDEMNAALDDMAVDAPGFDDPAALAARLKKLTEEQRKDFYAWARKMVQTSKGTQQQKGMGDLLDAFNKLDPASREAATVNRKMEEKAPAEEEALPSKVILNLRKDVKQASEAAQNARQLQNNLDLIRQLTDDPTVKRELKGVDLGLLAQFYDEIAMLQGLLAGAGRESKIAETGGPQLMGEIWKFVERLQKELQRALAESAIMAGLTVITQGAALPGMLNLIRRIKRIRDEIEKLREVYRVYQRVKDVIDAVSGLGATLAKFRRWYEAAITAYGRLEAQLEALDSPEDLEDLLEAQEERLLDELDKLLDSRFGALLEHLYIDESTSPEELQKILLNIPAGVTALGDMWSFYRAGNSKKDPYFTEVLAIKAAEAGMLLHPFVNLVASLAAEALQNAFRGQTSIGSRWERLVPGSKRGGTSKRDRADRGKRNRGLFGGFRGKHFDFTDAEPELWRHWEAGKKKLMERLDNAEPGSGTDHWAPAWFKHELRREIKEVNKLDEFKKATVMAERKVKKRRGGKATKEKVPLPRFRVRLKRPSPRQTTLEFELRLNPRRTISVQRLSNKDFRGAGIPYDRTPEKRKAALRKWLRDAGYQVLPHPKLPGELFIRLPGATLASNDRSYLHFASGRIKAGLPKNNHTTYIGAVVGDSEDLPEGYYIRHDAAPAPPARGRRRAAPATVDTIVRKRGLAADYPQLGFDRGRTLKIGGTASAPPVVVEKAQLKTPQTKAYIWTASIDAMFAPRRAGAPAFNLQGKTRAQWEKQFRDTPELKQRTVAVEGRLGYTVRARAFGDQLDSHHLPELRQEDDKGHMVGRRFGGKESYGNLAPMLRRQNQNLTPGEWYAMEEDIAGVYVGPMRRPGSYVQFQVELVYPHTRTRRPIRYIARTQEFNAAGKSKPPKMRTIKND